MSANSHGFSRTPIAAYAVAPLILLLLVGEAAAAKYRGDGGKRIPSAIVRTQANEKFGWALVRWLARCHRMQTTYEVNTKIGGKVDLRTKDRFRDKDTYWLRQSGESRFRITVTIKGRQVNAREWRGTFNGRVIAREAGRRVDTCKSGKRGWSALARA